MTVMIEAEMSFSFTGKRAQTFCVPVLLRLVFHDQDNTLADLSSLILMKNQLKVNVFKNKMNDFKDKYLSFYCWNVTIISTKTCFYSMNPIDLWCAFLICLISFCLFSLSYYTVLLRKLTYNFFSRICSAFFNIFLKMINYIFTIR